MLVVRLLVTSSLILTSTYFISEGLASLHANGFILIGLGILVAQNRQPRSSTD